MATTNLTPRMNAPCPNSSRVIGNDFFLTVRDLLGQEVHIGEFHKNLGELGHYVDEAPLGWPLSLVMIQH